MINKSLKFQNSFFLNAFIYTFSSFVSLSIPFLFLPLLTRILTPSDYGMVSLFMVAVSIFGVISGLNLFGALEVRYLAKKEIFFNSYFSACFLLIFISFSCVILLITLFINQFEYFFGLSFKWVYLAAFASMMQTMFQIRLSIWKVKQEALRYGVYTILQSLLNIGITLVLVLVIKMQWSGRVLAILLSASTFGALALLSFYRQKLFTKRIKMVHLWDAFKFGAPLIPHALGNLALLSADKLIVGFYLGARELGIYTVSVQLASLLTIFAVAINQAYGPWLISKLKSATFYDKQRIVFFSYIYFLGVFALAIFLAEIAPFFASVFLGKSFQGVSSNIIYLLIGSSFSGMYYFVVNYVFYTKNTSKLAVITLLCGLINIVVSLILIPKFGLLGAGLGLMISQIFLFLGTWVLASVVYKMPWFFKAVM